MKRFWLTAALVLPLTVAGTSLAADRTPAKNVILPAGQTVNGDYFASGSDVEVAGTVNGDVYAAGGIVRVSGTVNGDVLAAGGDVEIAGTVNGNVRAAGGQLLISGNVAKNATVAGGNLELAPGGRLAGNLVAAGGSIVVSGPVGGEVTAAGGAISLENEILGKVQLAAGKGQIVVGSTAHLAKDFVYRSNQDATISDGARIDGQTQHLLPVGRTPRHLGLGADVFIFISTLIIGLVLLALFGGWFGKVSGRLEAKPWAALGWGLVTLFITPIVVVLIMVTVVGLPLAFVVGGLYLISLYLASFFTVLWAGGWLSKVLGWKLNLYFSFILGLVVYSILHLIPIIGALTAFVTLLFGLGALWLETRDAFSHRLRN